MHVLPTLDVSPHSRSQLTFQATRLPTLRLVLKSGGGLLQGGVTKTNPQGRQKQKVLSGFQIYLLGLCTTCELKMGL